MTDKPTVVEALAAVMEEVRGVGKDGFHDAPGAKFKFRGIDAVVNAVGPALRKHRVVVVPQLVSIDHRDVLTSSGKNARETCVVVKYVWTGPDASTLETVVPGEAMDSGDKGTAKAMSVAFRIALLQALCLPTDDTDPDQSVYERAAPPQQRKAPESAADKARADLRAICAENKWDLKVVAGRFQEETGGSLRDATDDGAIRAFTSNLFSHSDSDLGRNGAPV